MACYDFDLLIAGAGPAGCTLALNLAPTGLRIGIIEKDFFPRDKICGDALSGKVLKVMQRMPGEVYGDFLRNVEKIPSWGIRFTAPGHHEIDVPFVLKREADHPAPGFVCRRNVFDGFLYDRLASFRNIVIFPGEPLEQISVNAGHILANTRSHEYRAKMIAGADGVHSTVRKMLQGTPTEKTHCCAGIRGYFENVSGLHPENYIELIFLKRLLPGYFWIFPSAGGLVNAGFGMMQRRVIDRRENLTRIFDDIIMNDPLVAPRFIHAKPAGKRGAHILPLGSHRLRRSGDRFILLGDAAFLVDPFSGEGIGNAMASGEIAASVLEQNFRKNDFSAGALRSYDARINGRFFHEFRTMSIMQRLAGSSWLLNLVVEKAGKNKDVKELLTTMYTNESARKKLTSAGFYAGLFFRR